MRPTEINLTADRRLLTLSYEDGKQLDLSAEYLRVYSPSAEVRGHGPGQETLQVGKEKVFISDIEPTGHYAVKLVFSDGHDSGIFDWNTLYDLGVNQEEYWADYLARLADAGHERKAN